MSNSIPLSELYKKMLLIRYFEEGVLKLFKQGKLFGTTHAYIGQEANAVGVITNLNKSDIVVSNHRCHGHYITHKENPFALLCEMMGKKDGLCSGRGGSQHICDDGFFSSGILGGTMPLAAGLAYSEKFYKTGNIVAVFIGDGALGEGVLYETLNFVSKWELPLLIIVENNIEFSFCFVIFSQLSVTPIRPLPIGFRAHPFIDTACDFLSTFRGRFNYVRKICSFIADFP